MPTYQIAAPDGKTYRIDGPDGASQNDVIAAVLAQHPEAGQEAPAKEEPGVLSTVGNALQRGAGTMIGGFAKPIEELPAIARAMNPMNYFTDLLPGSDKVNKTTEEAWKSGVSPVSSWFRETGKGITEGAAPRATERLADAYEHGGIGSALASAGETVVEGAIPTVGGLATGLLTKNPVAAMAVMGISSAPQTYTGIREDQESKGVDNVGHAVLGTAASTALDVLTGAGGKVASIGKKAILEAFEEGMRKAGREILKTGAEEAGTEALQNVIEQVAGHTDPTTKESLLSTLEAGVAGLVGGVGFGTVGEATNKAMAGKYRAAAAEAPALHTLTINRPLEDGTSKAEKVDIISAATDDGHVIIRGEDGKPRTVPLSALEETRVAEDEDVEAQPLADVLAAAVEKRNAEGSLDEATANAAANPNDDAAFDTLVDRLMKTHGLPRELATGIAEADLGRVRGTDNAPPNAPPNAPSVPPINTEQNQAAGIAPTYTVDSAIAEIERRVTTNDTTDNDALEKFVADNQAAITARTKQKIAGVAPEAAPVAAPEVAPVATGSPVAEAAGVTPPVVKPGKKPTQRQVTATKKLLENAFYPAGLKLDDRTVGSLARELLENPGLSVEDIMARYQSPEAAPVAEEEAAPPMPPPDIGAPPVFEEAAPEPDAGPMFEGMTPEQQAAMDTVSSYEANNPDTLADIRELVDAQATPEEIQTLTGLDPGLINDLVMGLALQEGAPLAPPSSTTSQEVEQKEPDTSAPTKPAPKVTKVPEAPRKNYAPRRGQVGVQGGQQEGAAELTEGMKAQQDLTTDLDKARENNEISNEEYKAVKELYTAPPITKNKDGTPNTSAIYKLPLEQRRKWLNVVRKSAAVEAIQKQLNKINKSHKDYNSLLKQKGELQAELDAVQHAIAKEAREHYEDIQTGRKLTKQAAEAELAAAKKSGDASRIRNAKIGLGEATIVSQHKRGNILKRLLNSKFRNQAEAMQKDLQGASFFEAAQWAIDNAPDPFHRSIATAIYKQLGRLEKMGFRFQFSIPAKGDVFVGEWENAQGLAYTDLPQMAIGIWLKPTSKTDIGGMYHQVLLHELIHAATKGAIEAGNRGYATGTQLAEGVDELHKVAKAIIDHFKARRDSGEKLTPFEEDIKDQFNNALDNVDEIIAWTLSNPDMQAYLETIPYSSSLSMFDYFVQAVRKFLGLSKNHDNALEGVLRASEAIMSAPNDEVQDALRFERTMQTPSRPTAMIDRGLFKAQQANDAAGFLEGLDEGIEGLKLSRRERQRAAAEAYGTYSRPWLLGAMASSTIKNLMHKRSKVVADIMEEMDKLDQKMRGLRSSMRNAIRRQVEEFQQFANKQGKRGMGAMSSMMTIARVNQVNPLGWTSLADATAKDPLMKHYRKEAADQSATPRRRQVAAARLTRRAAQVKIAWDAWEALGRQPNGHKIYEKVRQFYKDMYVAMRTEHDATIDELDISDDAKKALKEAARAEVDDFPNAPDDELVPKGETHSGVPKNIVPQEYFPFRRFGDYALLVDYKNKKKGDRQRYHFESPKERNEFQLKMAKQMGIAHGSPEYNEMFKRLDGAEQVNKSLSGDSAMLQRMFKIIDKADLTANTGADADAKVARIKDKLYQTFLMTLPERSMRKQFAHAGLITGQEADTLQVFKVTADQYMAQMPKLVYGRLMDNTISRAYDALPQGDSEAKLRTMLNEYVKRVRETMTGQPQSKLERAINTATFVELMTSIASAAVQPLTLPFQVVPRMLVRYGPIQTFKILGRYMPGLKSPKVFWDVNPETGEGSFGSPTLGNSAFVRGNALRSELWKRLNDERDLFSQKQIDMLLQGRKTNFTRNGANVAPLWDRIITGSGAVFGAADQITREVSGMAYAEMEYAKLRREGKTHEQALDGATDTSVRNVNETIGNYTDLERPGWLRGNAFKRMLGFLRSYAVARTAYYFNLVDAMTRGSDFMTRKQAFAEFSTVTAFGALGAGLPSLFGYSAICAVINTLLPLFFSDDDNEKRRKLDPLGADDVDYRLRYDFLPRLLGKDTAATRALTEGGLAAATGWDFSTRLSQNDMWIRDSKKGDTMFETAVNFLGTNLSPHVSQAKNISDGLDDISNGNLSKGFGKLVPAAVRGAVSAERLAREGEVTKAGYQTLKPGDITKGEIIGQVAGFTPTKLSTQREENRRIQSWQADMKKERGALMEKARKVVLQGGSGADFDKAIDEIQAYNRKVPPVPGTVIPMKEYRIDFPEDILTSTITSGKGIEESQHGVAMTPEERYYFEKLQ